MGDKKRKDPEDNCQRRRVIIENYYALCESGIAARAL
jgi:hypothetical protein